MNMTLGCSALRRTSAGSVSMRSMTAQPAGRVQGSRSRLRRPPVETMHGPAGIPETRFHFRQKCLRFGRVGNTCTSLCAFTDTLRAQHKWRVFITFRGNRGQSHLSYAAAFGRTTLGACLRSRFLREEWAPAARRSLAVSPVATALWRTSGRRFRSPTAHVGSASLWKNAEVAIFSTARLDTMDRSLEGHPISAHRKDGGFGCQSALVSDAQNSLCVLFRLLFGAEPLRLARSGTFGQKLNSVVSHASIVSPSELECPLFCAGYGSIPNCQNRNE